VQPIREIPPAPERLAPPALESPVACPSPRTASALLGPESSLAAAPVRPQADPEPQVITNAPDPTGDSPAKEKKEGNRFLRALHKIKLFHKGTSETQDSSSQ